jgi:hypothetical protein
MPLPFTVTHDTRCTCGADLTEPGSINIHLSARGHEFDERGSVDDDGTLLDPSNNVEQGLHAGSYCAACGALIDET